jgi:hypothetical protein
MKRVFSALILAVFIFIILNFLYCNLNDQAFNYPMTFRFSIPHLFELRSVPVQLGFVVITAFSLGILFLALLQAVPAVFKTIAVRSRDRKIRDLEKELEEARQAATMAPQAADEKAQSTEGRT